MQNSFEHITVLKNETIETILPSHNLLTSLHIKNEKELFFIDATLGGGGHTLHLIEKLSNIESLKNFNIHLIAFDRDQTAIEHTSKLLSLKKEQFHNFNFSIFQNNFSEILDVLEEEFPNQKIHGLFADFGLSSPQIDHQERGFSFLRNGPVDMRMDLSQSITAKDILLKYSLKDLTKLFFDYGEEPRSKKLAQAIVMDRTKNEIPVHDIKELANYFKRVLAYPPNSKTHPATRAFQALRIEVNNELESIERLLESIPKIIHPHGKASFISFHSLEDRLVKRAMRNWQKGKGSNENADPQNDFNLPLHIQLYLYDNKKTGFGTETPRGGIIPSDNEIKLNPRARSARLRCFEFSRMEEESNAENYKKN